MSAALKKTRTMCVSLAVAVSVCFTSVCGSYYQAAEAGGIAIWSLIEILFLSIGIHFQIENSVDRSAIDDALVEDIQETAEKIESGDQKGPLLELADYIANIWKYWDVVTGLTIPQTIWEALKFYTGERVEPRPVYRPVDADINLHGCSQEQYYDFFSSYFNLPLTHDLKSFLAATYPLFLAAGYSFIVNCYDGDAFAFFTLDAAESYSFREYKDGSTYYGFYPASSLGSGDYLKSSHYYSVTSDDYWPATNCSVGFTSNVLFMVKGRIYDLHEVCSEPENTTADRDSGTSFIISDFGISHTEICTGVGVIDGVTDIPLDDRDVLTPGREWDKEEEKLVGDVTLNIPSEKLLEDYYNGLLTWEELMELIGARPVDTSKPLDGIPGEDTAENIIDVVLGIPEAIVGGIAGLFLPGDGFIEGKLDEMMDRVNDLGILPYDMGYLFGQNGNPFRDIVIHMYGQDIVIVSFKYLPSFLDRFRPAIRGLMALFMLYYCVNQFLGLLRVSGVIQGDNGSKVKETGGSGK